MSSAAAPGKMLGSGRRSQRQLDAPSPGSATGSIAPPLAALHASAGHRAVHQLLGGGAPLPNEVRAEMEARFGTSFADVRVRADTPAHAAAAAMHAKAWTRGNEIGFGQGRFAPGSVEGRHLLAHELAHVVQQRRGGAAPPWQRGTFNEVAADRAATEVADGSGGPVTVDGASGVGVALAEVDGPSAAGDDATTAMMNRFRRTLLDAMLAGAGYGGAGAVLLAKATEGFSDQTFEELWREGKGKALLMNFLSLGFSGVAQAAAAYQVGLVEGALSPVTDAVKSLFGVGVLVESGRNFAWGLLKSAYNASGELGPEIEKLLADSKALASSTRESLKALANDPETMKWLLSLPEAADKALQQKAYDLGKAGASKVISTLESPWSQEEPAPEPEPELGLSTLASYVYSKAGSTVGAVHDYFISSPGAKIGESLGYAVGAVAVQVVMLLTSGGTAEVVEGLGLALAKVGTVLAKFSSMAGRAAGGAAELVKLLGTAIRAVDAAGAAVLGAMKGGLAKVFEKLAARVSGWFESALALLKRLLGIAEKEVPALPAARPGLAAAKVADAVPATSAGPTLVPPDTNGPTLVPDDSIGSDWDPDAVTELKAAPFREEPDRGPGPGLRSVDDTWDPDMAQSPSPAPGDAGGQETPLPRHVVESTAGSTVGPDDVTELKAAPFREEPDRGPGPGLRSVDDTWDPDMAQGTTPVPGEPSGPTLVPPEDLPPAPAPAPVAAPPPGPRHPRAPDLHDRPPYEDLSGSANAPRRGPLVDPATPEQLAHDRGPGGLRYSDEPGFVDPSPNPGPRRPPARYSPGSAERDQRQGRRGYIEPPPPTPPNGPVVRDMSDEEITMRRQRIEAAQRPLRNLPDPNAPAVEIGGDATEIIPPEEMSLIADDARMRLNWPEVVDHADLQQLSPPLVVNRRGRKKKRPGGP